MNDDMRPHAPSFARRDSLRRLLDTTALAGLAICLTQADGSTAYAEPKGGQVVAGDAAIRQGNDGRVDIDQKSDRAAIDWDSFSIGRGEHANFNQPSASAVTLNRVTGGDLSTIAGRLTANGRIILVNPNGVIFTGSAEVDVGALIASTSAIATDEFMAGDYRFVPGGNSSGAIVNDGSITVDEGGLAAFVAPWVENNGTIRARLGRVELASGDTFTLDLHGDGLIQLALARDPGMSAAVNNGGRIEADGGMVALSVADARNVVDRVINMDGIVQARTVGQRNGKIILGGNDVVTTISGNLDAAGLAPGAIGGQVVIAGHEVFLTETASIDVSGDSGGGQTLIGGGYQGARPIPAFRPSGLTVVATGARINADARIEGDGGLVVAWADGSTSFRGHATARGGTTGGDGGLIETSGKIGLDVKGAAIDASASDGRQGEWLLDPANVLIRDRNDNSGNLTVIDNPDNGEFFISSVDGPTVLIDPEDIENALANETSVRITTDNSVNDDDTASGTITVDDPISSASSAELVLLADDDIVFAGDGGIKTEGDVKLLAIRGAVRDNTAGPTPTVDTSGSLVLFGIDGIGTTIDPLRTARLARLAARTLRGDIAVSNSVSANLDIDSIQVFSANEPAAVNTLAGLSIVTPNAGDVIQIETDGDLQLLENVSAPAQSISLTSTSGSLESGSSLSGVIIGGAVSLTASNGIFATTEAGQLAIKNSSFGDVTLFSTVDTSIDVVQNGGGRVSLQGDGNVTIASLIAPGSDLSVDALADLLVSGPLGSSGARLGNIDLSAGGDITLAGISSIGSQTVSIISSSYTQFVDSNNAGGDSFVLKSKAGPGLQLANISSSDIQSPSTDEESAIHLAGSYDTGGFDFIADGPVILVDDTAPALIDTSGGDVDFASTVNGQNTFENGLTVRLGDGAISFDDSVGDDTPLGVLRIERLSGGAIVNASDILIDEDQATNLSISSQFGGDVSQFVISGLPVGATISDGVKTIKITAPGQPADLAGFDLDALTLTPPPNDASGIQADVAATAVKSSLDDPPDVFNVAKLVAEESSTDSFSVTVDPVADQPLVLAPDTIVANAGPIPLNIDVTSPDNDGSESLSLTIGNLPAGASLSAGLADGDGGFIIQQNELGGLALNLPNAGVLPIDLSIVATASDGGSSKSSDPFTLSVVPKSPPPPPIIGKIPPKPVIPASGSSDVVVNGDRAQQGPVGDIITINRRRDISPIITAAIPDKPTEQTDPFAVEPAAGEEEVKPDIWEACPDVVEASMAWQNTATDAAFNVDPDLIPYSVNVYCGGYQLTTAGRGAAQDYQGLSFVTRDFWTDLKQEKSPSLIDELRRTLFLDDMEG